MKVREFFLPFWMERHHAPCCISNTTFSPSLLLKTLLNMTTVQHKKLPKSIFQRFQGLNFLVKIEIEIVVILFLIFIGMFLFHKIEGWRYLDSLYFVITTLWTVGYGDFFPKTDLWKVLSMCYITIGVPLFIYTTALIVEGNAKSGKK